MTYRRTKIRTADFVRKWANQRQCSNISKVWKELYTQPKDLLKPEEVIKTFTRKEEFLASTPTL